MNLTAANKRMGLMELVRDGTGSITALKVSCLYDVLRNGSEAGTDGWTVDMWPLLTEGQRQQMRGINDRIQEVIDGL